MDKPAFGRRTVISAALTSVSIVAAVLLCMIRAATGEDFGLFEREGQSALVAGPSAAVITGVMDNHADWCELYFTNPQDEVAWSGGLDEILVADIDRAGFLVDIAAFDLDLQSVSDALVRASARGVQVRMVIDSDNADADQPQELIKAGILVVEDDRSAIMHNKFVIVDQVITWTGSWNFTENGTYLNNNNAIRFVSEDMARNYSDEFEEMFLGNSFGPTSPASTPHRLVTVRGTRLETYFAPEDSVMERIVAIVSGARQSIRFLAFSFTDGELAATLLERSSAGVLVEGVFESRGASSEHSQFDLLRDAGLSVWRDGNPATMHHKLFVVDGSTVILGSFNFTGNADRSNDENIVVIHDWEVAARYLDEFDRIMMLAR